MGPNYDLSGTPWRAIVLSERDDIWCLVDEVDYSWLIEFTWNVWHSGRSRWQLYAKRNVGVARHTVRMHREILKRADPRPDDQVVALVGDHLNGCTLDNRRVNLRWATHAENNANRRAFGEAPSVQLILMKLMSVHRTAVRSAALLTADVPF
jgi:hypothetical protein